MSLLEAAPAIERPDQGAARGPRTTIPAVGSAAIGPRRATGRMTRNDIWCLVGAGCSSICTTLLLFGRLTPLTGKFGFVVVGFVLFLLTYATLVSLTERKPAVVDRVMSVLLTTAAFLAVGALTTVIFYVLRRGWPAMIKPNFWTQDLSLAGPLDPLTVGGVTHALAGTLIMTAISLVLTVPLGVCCAVYLNETGGRGTNIVRSVVTAMTALPSIIAGLFVFATWILLLGFPRSGFAASLAMSIVMLPIMIRSADVVLRLVPGNLREASAALSAPQWRTVWHVVLPTARTGLTTSVILGVARGIGETAPILLTAGVTNSLNLNPFANPMGALPLSAFLLVRSPQETMVARGFATAAALMLLVLLLFTIARVVGGKPIGRLSKRQARRTARRSAADLLRMSGGEPGGVS